MRRGDGDSNVAIGHHCLPLLKMRALEQTQEKEAEATEMNDLIAQPAVAKTLTLPGHPPDLLANLTLWRMWAVKLDDSELRTARAELTRYEKTLTGRTAEELQVVRIIDLVVSEGARRFFRL